MRIVIDTTPHNDQRYNSVGDWRWEATSETLTTLHIRVSEFPSGMKNSKWKYEFLIGIHELVEAILCESQGISEKQVDDFDINEKIDEECFELDVEQGDHPEAPYKHQHNIATGIERILCATLGIDWYEYDHQIEKMCEAYNTK